MATKHLSNFYSYKFIPQQLRFLPAVIDTGEALEKQVQAHLANGHQYFFRDEFQNALVEYQTAYSLLHKFLHPNFPTHVATQVSSVLLGLELTEPMIAASAQVAKYRSLVGRANIISPLQPPPEVSAVVKQFSGTGTARPLSAASSLFQQASTYLQTGAVTEARPLIERALRLNDGQDRELETDLLVATGILAVQQQEFAQARKAFQEAFQVAQESQRGRATPDLAAINNNLGVVAALAGDAASAGAAFQAAGDQVPLSFGRRLSQQLNPGIATVMERPMGGEGLSLIVHAPHTEQQWIGVSPATETIVAAQQFGVFAGTHMIDVNLQGDAAANLVASIYEPRINAISLAGLAIFEEIETNVIAYLPHMYGFTIPLSLGDCYLELGDFIQAIAWYQKARDYPFLNTTIEAPMVWLKLATAFLRWGNFLLESGEKTDARDRYEKIVRLNEPILDPTSPLYKSPVFDGLAAQVQAILAAPQPIDPNTHNPSIAANVFLAKLNLQNIEAGIDFPLLSLEREQIPVFRFDYLQNVARYFAEHAIQAERTYINFKTSAEQEEFTRSMLQNSVALEQANEILEAKKVEIANEQKEAIDANQRYANKQLENANQLKTEYQNVSLEEIALDSETTYVGAPTTEYEFSGYGEYGISDGTHRADEVLRTLTRRRREISREFELHNIDRRISELEAAKAVADEQVDIAIKQKEAAELQKGIATLRRQQAEQQLALFDSQEFTPDLWNRLAHEIREISRSYLNQAIVVARLMEQAYEFEIGKPLDIIKPNYVRSELSGLLAGDFLLRDIDSFTFFRILLSEKKQPMKEIISLADRYPVQFLRDFQRTGRMEFRTELNDFDRGYPGAYQQRIKRVEVIVEGLIGREGLHASLTNTGLCLTRMRNGGVKMRLLQPETLLLSRYKIGLDNVVFTPDQEMLAVFEHSPISTSWIFELSPAANDIVLNYITDVKLVIYYESFFDPGLKPLVLEELAAEQINSGRRSVALRYELFDEFFVFQDTGEVTFTLRQTMLPFYQTEPRIRELTVLIETDEGISPENLTIRMSAADGTAITQVTTVDGAISTGGMQPLNAFLGRPWLQQWTIAIPEALNQARFDAGFEWSQVRNIIMIAEYEFVPRRIPGEPFLQLLDRFDQNTLSEFDVFDDPLANVGGPSAWTFNSIERRIEQTSDIHGGPEGPAANDPNKPGTYLVRKATTAHPAIQNFILACDLSSQDDDGIGLVFRWQDVDNFYYFLMDRERNYRRIGKKVGGLFQELAMVAFDAGHGYDANQIHSVRVRVSGSDFSAWLDGDQILSGQDNSLSNAGRMGLFSWASAGAGFDNFRIIEI